MNALSCVSAEEFQDQKYRRYGTLNPEIMNFPFWQYMVRSGISAWEARQQFANSRLELTDAVWCFDRFGASKTSLTDNRSVNIGGEHEDFYDDDFCIYNDVVVFDDDKKFTLYGYPKHVFPPTDFHSATLINNSIYIIGGLGYLGERVFEETPVYVLNATSFEINVIKTTGNKPGWIHQHEAVFLERDHLIYISGGLLSQKSHDQEILTANIEDYVLDLTTMKWRRVKA